MCVHKDGAVYLSDTLADEWLKLDVKLSDVPVGVVRGAQFAHDSYYCINCRKEWNHCDPEWLWCGVECQQNANRKCNICCCPDKQCQDALDIHEINPAGHKFGLESEVDFIK